MVAEIPQSIDFDLGRTNLVVNQRCGNCKHLSRIAHPAYEKVCKEHGMTEKSKPCERFSADPTKIKLRNRSARNAVEFLQEMSDDRLALFASLINEEARTRRNGFRFGQTVYLNIFGGDYFSNYRRMKVISATKDYVNLVSDEDSFTAMVYSKNVLTTPQWLKKKQWLIDNERLTDPRYKKYTQSVSHAEMQIQKIKDKLTVLEFDSTSRHSFAETQGVLSKGSKYSDRARHVEVTDMIRVR